MNASSSGSAAPSLRSIDVKANLLLEWTTEQARRRREVCTFGVGILLCAAIAGSLLPGLESARRAFAKSADSSASKLAEVNAALALAESAKKAVEPQVAISQVRAETSSYCDRLLGELFAVLDSGNSGMAFSSARAEVHSAEIVIDCRGEAESFDSASAFAEQAGRTPNKLSGIASSRPSNVLSPNGISFEYMKRISLQ